MLETINIEHKMLKKEFTFWFYLIYLEMVVKQSVISQHNMDQWMDGRVLVLVNMLIVNTDKVQSFSHQFMHSQSSPFIQRIKNIRMF